MFPSIALVRRELLTTLRRARVFVWIVLLMVCAIGIVWLNWPEQNASPSRVADNMTEIVAYLSIVMLGGCILFIPSVSAAAIVSEREQDTLDLLRLGLVRPVGIVGAKFLNTVGLFALLLVALAPAIGASLFGVGLDRVAILQAAMVLFTVAITCALAGLASSAFFRKTIWAVLGAYGLTAAAFLIPPIVVALSLVFPRSEPLFAIAASFVNEHFLGGGPVEFFNLDEIPLVAIPPMSIIVVFQRYWSGWWILMPIIMQVPFWLLFPMLTLRWLRTRDVHTVVDDDKPIDDLEVLKARREQFPYYLIDPLKRKKPIEDSLNPMFIREVRWGLFSKMTVLMRLCLAVFAMFFIGALFPVFYDSGRTSDSEIVAMWAAVQYFITLLFAPALVANTFTKERELGNFDMMRMTLLSPRQILAGKAGAGLIVLSPLIVAVLAASIPLLFIGLDAYPRLAMSIITGLVWAALCVMVSVTVSLAAKRTVGAIVASYGVLGFTFLILNFLVEFLWIRFANGEDGISGYDKPPPGWVDAITALNPASAVLNRFGNVSWAANTGVAIAVIVSCYCIASIFLARYRMQDR